MDRFAAVILAAGLGKRMRSDLPKVLHKAAGKPLIGHVVETARAAGCERLVVVIGNGGELVKSYLGDSVEYACQPEQLGTGHAVMQAEPALEGWSGTVVVLYGDAPTLRSETLKEMVSHHVTSGRNATIAVAELDDPSGYGRVVRTADGEFDRIVEEKDATESQKLIHEINCGLYAFDRDALFSSLLRIRNVNAQGEYYLTDVLGVMRAQGDQIGCFRIVDASETMGINSRSQLAEVEQVLRDRVRQALMDAGVTLIDPSSTYIDAEVTIGRDTVVYPFTFIEGRTVIGERCTIFPNCRIVNSQVGSDTVIDNAVILESTVGSGVSIGPFAYIRPQSYISDSVKIGDFTEIKKSTIGRGSKVPHLSYIGDAVIGENVNIGAGTITCNYDGKRKSTTIVGDNAFVGSNTNLVAPVTVGSGAFVAAGSTITKGVPDGALGIARARQVVKEGYIPPYKRNS